MNQELKIVFSGDVSLSGIFGKKVRENQEILDKTITNEIHKNDYFVANLEGPVHAESIDNSLVQPLNAIEYLCKRNINVFNLSNNHIFDRGIMGLQNTVSAINKQNALYFGAGRNLAEASAPLYLSRKGISVALIGIGQHEGLVAAPDAPGIFSSRHMRTFRQAVKGAKNKAHWVIVCFHGGEEYTRYPSPPKKRLLSGIASLKEVDVIIAHHSHTIQGVVDVKGKPVFYSLGNFIFDFHAHYQRKYTDLGMLVEFTFTKSSRNHRSIPILINKEKGTVEKSSCNIRTYLTSISDFNRYQWVFRKDAFRFVSERNDIKKQSIAQNGKQSTPKIFKVNFYKRLWSIMNNPYTRSVFLAAWQYKIEQFFRHD